MAVLVTRGTCVRPLGRPAARNGAPRPDRAAPSRCRLGYCSSRPYRSDQLVGAGRLGRRLDDQIHEELEEAMSRIGTVRRAHAPAALALMLSSLALAACGGSSSGSTGSTGSTRSSTASAGGPAASAGGSTARTHSPSTSTRSPSGSAGGSTASAGGSTASAGGSTATAPAGDSRGRIRSPGSSAGGSTASATSSTPPAGATAATGGAAPPKAAAPHVNGAGVKGAFPRLVACMKADGAKIPSSAELKQCIKNGPEGG
jgi:hypothetical protein